MSEFLYLNNDENLGDSGLYSKEELLRQIAIFNEDPPYDPMSLNDFNVRELDGTYSADTLDAMRYWVADTPYFSISSRDGSNSLRWGTFRYLPEHPDFAIQSFPGLENLKATAETLEFAIGSARYYFRVSEPPHDEFGRTLCQDGSFPLEGFVYYEDRHRTTKDNNPRLKFPDKFEVDEFFEWARFKVPCQFSKIVDENADGVHGFFCLTSRPGLLFANIQRILDRYSDHLISISPGTLT